MSIFGEDLIGQAIYSDWRREQLGDREGRGMDLAGYYARVQGDGFLILRAYGWFNSPALPDESVSTTAWTVAHVGSPSEAVRHAIERAEQMFETLAAALDRCKAEEIAALDKDPQP